MGQSDCIKAKNELFYTVLRETYEKGTKENEITIKKLMDELIIDLKKLCS